MDYVIIQGVKPYDGRYEFDANEQEFTTREWGWIKRLAGHSPLTASDWLRNLDPELLTVIAAIALRRAGKVDARDVPDVFDTLADAPFTSSIQFESDSTDEESEEDASPPASDENLNGKPEFSGHDSPTSSEKSMR